ncbi:MAG: succinate dehydrogenase, hydrophobic membrane anchor protein [Proteobacteria bacterium]|nr:succinate dehydrogenase, hydrophobic membrane anchor protein [Pseudomonadota bacterium]
MSLETPLHKVEGLGPAHSGVKHFWRQRVSATALVPLSIWLGVSLLGLVGGSQADMAAFLQTPLNAGLLAAFILIAVYHMVLGLQVIIDDYIYVNWQKLLSMFAMWAFALAVVAVCLFDLLRIAG